MLLPLLEPHVNKNKSEKKERKEKIQIIETILEKDKKKYISENNIPENQGNYWKLVEENQNIQD